MAFKSFKISKPTETSPCLVRKHLGGIGKERCVKGLQTRVLLSTSTQFHAVQPSQVSAQASSPQGHSSSSLEMGSFYHCSKAERSRGPYSNLFTVPKLKGGIYPTLHLQGLNVLIYFLNSTNPQPMQTCMVRSFRQLFELQAALGVCTVGMH